MLSMPSDADRGFGFACASRHVHFRGQGARRASLIRQAATAARRGFRFRSSGLCSYNLKTHILVAGIRAQRAVHNKTAQARGLNDHTTNDRSERAGGRFTSTHLRTI